MMLAAIVKKKRISKGFTDDLCSTTVQVDLIVRKDMKKSLKYQSCDNYLYFIESMLKTFIILVTRLQFI